MKLISTSILASVALAQQNGTWPAPPTEVPQNPMMLRASGTNNPVIADFDNAVSADISYNNNWWGNGGNCGYIKYTSSGSQEVYSTGCDGQICCGGQGVPCEWRGNDISTLPAAGPSYNGWHCNQDNTVCFATIETNINWWAAMDLCESTFGMRLAAPKNMVELNLIKDNYKSGQTRRFWTAVFWDTNESAFYWAHDSTKLSSWVTDDSESSDVFEDADYLDQASQTNAPTEILETMLFDHGVAHSSQQQGGARKKRETAAESDTISSLIQRNGCWCPAALAGGERFPGAPLNDYDSKCRKLSHCINKASTCASGACYSDNTNQGFQWAFDVTDVSKGFSCRSTNACDTAICMCQVEFAKDVFELVVADSDIMTIDDGHLDLADGTQCVAPQNGAGTGNAGTC